MTISLVEHVPEAASTNDLAMARVRAGCEHGWAIHADRQTAGRGRHGRSWIDGGGRQLFLSVAICGPRYRSELPRLPLAAGVGVARAVERMTDLRPGLKWPNDLQLDGRKLGGILCEAVFEGTSLRGAVVGIGLNIDAPGDGFPPELAARTTALGEHAPPPAADALAAAVRHEVVAAAGQLANGEAAAVLDAWRSLDVTAAHPLLLPDGTRVEARGIADDGALIVALEDGTLTTVRSGEVRRADDASPTC